MREILYSAHSGIRYLVLLAAVVAIVYLLAAVVRKQPYSGTSKALMGAFTGLLDLQVLLGLINLMLIPFYGALAGHIVMMFMAAMVGHGFVIVNRNRPEQKQSNAFLLAGVVVTLVLVVGGIMSIGRPILGSS